jgi:site-specific recombinase XerD
MKGKLRLSERKNEILDSFIEYLDVNERKSPATIRSYVEDMKQFIAWLNDKKITQRVINEYLDYLETAKLKTVRNKIVKRSGKTEVKISKGTYSIATVNRKLSSISKYFTFKEIPLKVPKLKAQSINKLKEVMTLKDYKKLEKAARTRGAVNHRTLMILKLLVNTGFRVSELLSIERNQVSFLLKKTVPQSLIIQVKGKGNKYREVVINHYALKAIKQYLRFGDYTDKTIETGYLFVGKKGRMTRQGVHSILKRLAESSGVEEDVVYPHNFRHLTAVCLSQVGIPLETVAQILGHEIKTTTEIYTSRGASEIRGIMDKLGKYIESGGKLDEEKNLKKLSKDELINLLLGTKS